MMVRDDSLLNIPRSLHHRRINPSYCESYRSFVKCFNAEKGFKEAIKALKKDKILPFAAICQKEVARVLRGDPQALIKTEQEIAASVFYNVRADIAGVVSDLLAAAAFYDDEVVAGVSPDLLASASIGEEVCAGGDRRRPDFIRDLAFRTIEEVLASYLPATAALYDEEAAAGVSPYLLAPGSMGEEVLADGAGSDLPATTALSDDEVPVDDLANLLAPGPMGDEVLADGAGDDIRAAFNFAVLAGNAGGFKRAAFKVEEVSADGADGDLRRPDFIHDLAFRTIEEVLASYLPATTALYDDEVAAGVSPYLLAPGSMGEEVLADGAGGDLAAVAAMSDDEVPVDDLANLLAPGPMGDEVLADGAGDDMRARINVHVLAGDAGGSKQAALKVEVHGGNADGDFRASFEVYDEEAANGVLRGSLRIDMYDKEKNGHKSARKLPRALRAVHYILVICLLVAKIVLIGLILAGYFVRSPPLE